jgi:hypothetical protein
MGEYIVIGIAIVGTLFFINDLPALIWYAAVAALLTFFLAPFLAVPIGKLLLLLVNPTLARHARHSSLNKYPPVKKARQEGFRYESSWW